MTTYATIAEIRAADAKAGHYFFGPDATRFFRTRIAPGVINGRYFITSEKFRDDAPRLYTIRRANDDGTIDTVGEFQQYKTLRAARAAARQLPN